MEVASEMKLRVRARVRVDESESESNDSEQMMRCSPNVVCVSEEVLKAEP